MASSNSPAPLREPQICSSFFVIRLVGSVISCLDERLELARSFGIPYTVNPAKEDAVARVMEITKGRGTTFK